jgi:hypothetical protein
MTRLFSAIRGPLFGLMLGLALHSHFAWGTTSTDGTKTGIMSLAGSSGQIQYNNGGTALAASPLWVEDANTVAQRNGTSAQNFFPHNTYTDGSNYERARVGYLSNAFVVGTEQAGTGTARVLHLRTGGTSRWDINATTGNFEQLVTGQRVLASYVRTSSTTFASLPTAAAAGNGTRAYISDATLTFTGANIGAAAAGGGANHSPVTVVNGAWVIG